MSFLRATAFQCACMKSLVFWDHILTMNFGFLDKRGWGAAFLKPRPPWHFFCIRFPFFSFLLLFFSLSHLNTYSQPWMLLLLILKSDKMTLTEAIPLFKVAPILQIHLCQVLHRLTTIR